MPPVPFRDFSREILKQYHPPHRRKSTHAKLKKVLDEFAALPGLKRTSDITPAAIVDWLNRHSDRKAITNYSYLSAFRAAVNYARKMRYLRVTPWEIRSDWIDLDDGGEDDDGDFVAERHLTLREIVGLFDVLDAEAISGGWVEARLQSLVYTYAYTGMRKSEVLGMRASDVNVPGRYFRLKGRKKRRLKTSRSARLIPIHPELATILYRWMPLAGSDWLFPGKRKRAAWLSGSAGEKALDQVKAAGTRAGIANLTIQDFRRSIATHAKLFGLGQLEVRDMLGHTNLQTQDWYLEDDLENLREAYRKIDYRAAMPTPAR